MYYLGRIKAASLRLRADQVGDSAQVLAAAREELEGKAMRAGARWFDVLTVERVVHAAFSDIDEQGLIKAELTCDVLVAAPFDGEVVDAIVLSIGADHLLASSGALDVLVLAADGQHGRMRDEYAYEEAGGRRYVSSDVTQSERLAPIEKGSRVRLRIVVAQHGERGPFARATGSLRHFFAVTDRPTASLNCGDGDYLGCLAPQQQEAQQRGGGGWRASGM